MVIQKKILQARKLRCFMKTERKKKKLKQRNFTVEEPKRILKMCTNTINRLPVFSQVIGVLNHREFRCSHRAGGEKGKHPGD